jgi:hypothetical protein
MEAHCEGGQSPPRAVMSRKEGVLIFDLFSILSSVSGRLGMD